MAGGGDPFDRFERVWVRAAAAAPFDPSAVALATVDVSGRPSVRMVLLKGHDEQGFRFFSNYESRKGAELEANRHAALCFYWAWIDEQVRVEGTVERLPEAESDAYFATRDRFAQLGAWASRQSRPLETRFGLLRRVVRAELRHLGRAVPRPPHWGGYLLRPRAIEFWVAKPSRLHERTRFERDGEGWRSVLLQP